MTCDCGTVAIARGLCQRHYVAAYRAGTLDAHARRHWGRGTRPCAVEGCTKLVVGGGRGLCPMHYRRWQRDQDPRIEPYTCADCGRSFSTIKAQAIHRSRMHGYLGDHAAACRRDYEAHKERFRLNNFRRRARKVDAAGSCSSEQLVARIAVFGWRCWMCGDPWEHIDHVIPLARGGTNWPANLRPACGRCNRRKHAKKVA